MKSVHKTRRQSNHGTHSLFAMSSVTIAFLLGCCISVAHSSEEMHKTNYFESFFVEPTPGIQGRNALKIEQYKWPNGIVPYVFHADYNQGAQTTVLQAMTTLTEKTCVQFVEKRVEHVEHIQFTKSPACGSVVGFRRGQDQPLNVTYSDYCLTVPGAIQHELLHVLGLLHEQARPDRDDYVEIHWENIDTRELDRHRL